MRRTILTIVLLASASVVPAHADDDALGLSAITLDAPAEVVCDGPTYASFDVEGTLTLLPESPVAGGFPMQSIRITIGDDDAAITQTDMDGKYAATLERVKPSSVDPENPTGGPIPYEVVATYRLAGVAGVVESSASSAVLVKGSLIYHDGDGDGYGRSASERCLAPDAALPDCSEGQDPEAPDYEPDTRDPSECWVDTGEDCDDTDPEIGPPDEQGQCPVSSPDDE